MASFELPRRPAGAPQQRSQQARHEQHQRRQQYQHAQHAAHAPRPADLAGARIGARHFHGATSGAGTRSALWYAGIPSSAEREQQ
jgi:hypothetical protein